ncbi:GTP cyclohydrolase 1 [Gnomoniopsis sp. IMI 355080]|nr:GTP cyclohydrolase 1 [Gnomoniopsis sp. IMI 355080]
MDAASISSRGSGSCEKVSNNELQYPNELRTSTYGRHRRLSVSFQDEADKLTQRPKEKCKNNQEDETDGNLEQQYHNGDSAHTTTSSPITHSPVPVLNLDGLFKASLSSQERMEETKDQSDARLARMCGAIRTILECVGEDADREGLLETPSRYAKAILFLTKGYQQNLGDVVNRAIFNEDHNEMVIVKNIEISSMCEHHLLPFTGKMHIGYIPNRNVIGISKLPRIAELFARRLQIQERLTKEVANALMETLKPQGVAVVFEASHLCMVLRGVEKTTTSTITRCLLGSFESMEKTKIEFLTLIGIHGHH